MDNLFVVLSLGGGRMAGKTKDIRLEVKVRNNLLLTKMEEVGIWTVAEMCRRLNIDDNGVAHSEGLIHQTTLGKLINMKLSARDKDGEWIPLALRLAEFFKCVPEDLFSEPQQYERLERNRAHAEIAFTEVQRLTSRQEPVTPEIAMQAKQLQEAIGKALQTLTAREQAVIRLRFGFEGDELTHDEIGERLGYSGGRIQQLEAKALRKLKRPARAIKLVLAGGTRERKVRTSRWGHHYYTDEYHLDEDVLSAI